MKRSKKGKYVVILLLLCGVFIVFGIKANSFEFPQKVKTEIEEALVFIYERDVNMDEYEYYGTYSEAVVFFSDGEISATVIWEKNVAGVEFKWPRAASIMVYKDGLIYSLEKAYEDGLLTERNIKSISRRHEWNKIKHGYGEYERVFGQ